MDDLSQVAVGFANGSVTVIRGDLINDRGAKQRTVFESEEPVTGVELRDNSKITTLYIATTGRILTLIISGRGQGQPARTLENTGCGVDCMTIDQSNGDLVVARDDAIYFYRPPGRGPCYAFEGPKKMIRLYKDYIVLVSPPKPSSPTKSPVLPRYRSNDVDDLFSTTTFSVLDTDLKFVAHSESLVTQIKAVFIELGDLFVLTLDGKVRLFLFDIEQSLTIIALPVPGERLAAKT